MIRVTFLFCTLALIVCVSSKSFSQTNAFEEIEIMLNTPTGAVHGTLTTPKTKKKVNLALIIAGSGPTDRNGNSKFSNNESLRLLAHDLADKNIASVRFDKRGIAASEAGLESEEDLRFETYVDDAKAWIDMIKADKRFKKLVIIGHSEGSLIGMLASEKVNGYISLSGPGQVADQVLKAQLSSIPEAMKKSTFASIDTLRMGNTLKTIDPRLYSIFRPSVQPYLISWFKYDPAIEISKLEIPVMIIQGTTDLQVPVEEAKLLSKSNPKAKLVIIEEMNHVLRKVSSDRDSNIATYSNPTAPLHPDLVKNIVAFIKKV